MHAFRQFRVCRRDRFARDPEIRSFDPSNRWKLCGKSTYLLFPPTEAERTNTAPGTAMEKLKQLRWPHRIGLVGGLVLGIVHMVVLFWWSVAGGS